jgi:hypothetical protein
MKVILIKYINGNSVIYYNNTIYDRHITFPYKFNYKEYAWQTIILTKKEFDAIQSKDQVVRNIIFNILDSKYKI